MGGRDGSACSKSCSGTPGRVLRTHGSLWTTPWPLLQADLSSPTYLVTQRCPQVGPGERASALCLPSPGPMGWGLWGPPPTRVEQGRGSGAPPACLSHSTAGHGCRRPEAAWSRPGAEVPGQRLPRGQQHSEPQPSQSAVAPAAQGPHPLSGRQIPGPSPRQGLPPFPPAHHEMRQTGHGQEYHPPGRAVAGKPQLHPPLSSSVSDREARSLN